MINIINKKRMIFIIVVSIITCWIYSKNFYNNNIGNDLYSFLAITAEKDLIYYPSCLIIIYLTLRVYEYYIIRFENLYNLYIHEFKRVLKAVCVFTCIYICALLASKVSDVITQNVAIEFDIKHLILCLFILLKRIMFMSFFSSIIVSANILKKNKQLSIYIIAFVIMEIIYLWENYVLKTFILTPIVDDTDGLRLVINSIPLLVLSSGSYNLICAWLRKSHMFLVSKLTRRMSKLPILTLLAIIFLIIYISHDANLAFDEFIGLFFEFAETSIFLSSIQFAFYINVMIISLMFLDNLDIIRNKEFILRLGDKNKYNAHKLIGLVLYMLLLIIFIFSFSCLLYNIFTGAVAYKTAFATLINITISVLFASIVMFYENVIFSNDKLSILVVLALFLDIKFKIIYPLVSQYAVLFLILISVSVIVTYKYLTKKGERQL